MDGWQERPLDECLKSFHVPAKIQRNQFAEKGPFPIISQEASFVNGHWDKPEDVCVLDGAVVIFGDHTQVLKYVDFDFVVGADGVKVLDPKEFLEPKYLYYFLMAHRAPSLGYARHYRHVRETIVRFPNSAEQQRIVAVLDEVLDGLAGVRTHAEANLQNARAWFERSLTIELGEKSAEVGSGSHALWPEVELGDVVSFHNGDRGRNYPNKNEYVSTGIPWLNTGQILPDGSLSAAKMNFISQEKFDSLGGGRIRQGDLVFCLRGATIGKTAFVEPYVTGAVASSLMIIRPGEAITNRYLYYFLTSALGKSEISRFIGGAAQPNLAGESVGKFKLCLPPVEEQDLTVARLDRMKAECEMLELLYRARIQDTIDLQQSILEKAFAGELN